jgi:hypothetical protein
MISNTLSKPTSIVGSSITRASGLGLGLIGPRRMPKEGLLRGDFGLGVGILIFYVNRLSGYVVAFRPFLPHPFRLYLQIIITLFPLLSPSSPSLPAIPLNSITPFYPLAPAIVICTLFFSSTLFTESISRSRYPEKYAMYQERVAMFVPFLTPVWVFWTQFRGRREVVDEGLWGSEKSKEKGE